MLEYFLAQFNRRKKRVMETMSGISQGLRRENHGGSPVLGARAAMAPAGVGRTDAVELVQRTYGDVTY